VLVSLILIPLFAALLQLGFALYVRNTLAACAQEGARYAADADIVAQGGAAMTSAATDHATSCVGNSLPASFAQGVTSTTPIVTNSGGEQVSVVEVQIASPFPLIGLFGAGPQVLHVKADAMQEQP
jgi:hypothetical protein